VSFKIHSQIEVFRLRREFALEIKDANDFGNKIF
jgi:hypothetical protein